MGVIGVAPHESGPVEQLAAIELADRLGVPAAWLTTGGVGPDSMVIFAAAAAKTSRIELGTAIVPTWPRETKVTVTLEEETGGKTKLNVRWSPH